MAAIGTLPVVLGTGDHASRPAAADVGAGGLYSCTDHDLIYQTDGSSWTTWATVGGAAGGYPALTVADVNRTTDVAVGSSAYTDIISLALGTGTWDVYAIAGVANGGGGASTLYAAITQNDNTQLAQEHFSLPASGITAIPVMAPGVAGSQTIKLRVFSTNTAAVEGSTNVGTGGGSKIHAVRVA